MKHNIPSATVDARRPQPLPKRLQRPGWQFGLSSLLWLAAQAQAALPVGTTPGGPTECSNKTTLNVKTSATQVNHGQSVTVTWVMNTPPECMGEDLYPKLNGLAVDYSGSRTSVMVRDQHYSLQLFTSPVAGARPVKSAGASVKVLYPYLLRIDPNTPKPVDSLLGVLSANNANPTQIVELCAVDLDLSRNSNIVIGDNRTLRAAPNCARGARSHGPRIFVSDRRSWDKPLLVVRGDNVDISGFRLEGPSPDIASDRDNNLEVAIQVWPQASSTALRSVNVSNMEIWKWSGAGISIIDNADATPRGRMGQQNVGAVRVANNYIHHNRHTDGFGYGVVVGVGGYALIEHNVFDQNRHAIAGDSGNGRGDWSGYTIQENLILAGGGVHCAVQGVACWQTHQIDMHGDKDLPANPFCCGTAGETLLITRNTILYTGGLRLLSSTGPQLNVWDAGLAIKVRGNPADRAVIDGNVFRHTSRDAAMQQNGNGIWPLAQISKPLTVLANNVYGADPMASLGQCDFVGDGKLDAFMATGVTWWAKSPVTQQWRFLNAMPGELSQLMLYDLSGDGRCDVVIKPARSYLPPTHYSSGGTSGWLPYLPVAQ